MPADFVERLARKWCCGCTQGTPDHVHVILAAAIWEALVKVESLIQKHRHHVEQSPGMGKDCQRYGLAVADDILIDLAALREGAG